MKIQNRKQLALRLFLVTIVEIIILYFVISTMVLSIVSFICWDSSYVLQAVIFWKPPTNIVVLISRLAPMVFVIIFDIKLNLDSFFQIANKYFPKKEGENE